MLKIITQLSMFLVGTLAQAQVSETREVNQFSKIEVSGNVELVLSQAAEQNVTAQAPDAASLAGIVTEAKGNTLYVLAKTNAKGTKVSVNANELSAISLSGGSRACVTNGLHMREISVNLSEKSIFTGNLNAEKLEINLKSGSFANASVTAENFVSALSGNSNARFSGMASNATILASGKSTCYAKTLVAARVDIDAEERSAVSANAAQKIHVGASEDSTVSWAGLPKSVTLPEGARIVKSNTAAISGL